MSIQIVYLIAILLRFTRKVGHAASCHLSHSRGCHTGVHTGNEAEQRLQFPPSKHFIYLDAARRLSRRNLNLPCSHLPVSSASLCGQSWLRYADFLRSRVSVASSCGDNYYNFQFPFALRSRFDIVHQVGRFCFAGIISLKQQETFTVTLCIRYDQLHYDIDRNSPIINVVSSVLGICYHRFFQQGFIVNSWFNMSNSAR